MNWDREPETGPEPGEENEWQRRTLENLLFATIREQRRGRRWNIFFRLLFFAYLTFFVVALWPKNLATVGEGGPRHTAVVEISGVISSATQANAERVIEGLRDAFRDKNTAGVVVQINSPGGSPVQAGRINQEMRRLKGKYPDKPLISVVEDICASGGYYIAVAGDKIYADKASLVGSIGVIMNGFGFVDAMDKLGVERRLMAAGDHKGFLDPFSPLKPEEMAHVQGLLKGIHEQFIEVVKLGRGERLKAGEELFSGLVWTGAESVELGLTDGLGDLDYVAREIIGARRIVNFTVREDLFSRFAQGVGRATTNALLEFLQLSTALH